MKKIKICSLFSGIGGFETGIFNAFGKENCEIVFSSEIDKYASKSYETIYGHTPHGDITKIEAIDIPDHDLLVGGFPCQAFSIAGKREGFNDKTRGTLFFEIARIAKEKKPKVMLLENVKGLLNHDDGKTLEIIIHTLSELGYYTDFQLLNSKNFGVPQNRERIFIIAVRDVEGEKWNISKKLDSISKAKKRLSSSKEVKSFNFIFPSSQNISISLQELLEESVDEKYFLDNEKTVTLLKKVKIANGFSFDSDGILIREGEISTLNNLHQIGFVQKNSQGNRIYSSEGLSATIASQTGGVGGSGGGVYAISMKPNELKFVGGISEKPNWLENGKELSRNYKQGSRVYDSEGIATTLTSQGVGGLGGFSGLYLVPQWKIRKLTPLECLRLQGFPDTYYDKLKEIGISDSQLYKMAGNAVTTNVISAIAKCLKCFL